MKHILLILALISSPGYAETLFNLNTSGDEIKTILDKISFEVNKEFVHIKDNCLITAFEKQFRLRKQSIESEVIAIMPYRSREVGHAVLCVEDNCVDNGDISDDVFDRSEVEFHGEIIENHIAVLASKMKWEDKSELYAFFGWSLI